MPGQTVFNMTVNNAQFNRLTNGLADIALEAIASKIPATMAGPNTLVPIKTGLLRDSFDAEVVGNSIAVSNDATNPRTGEQYAIPVEEGIPAPRTKGKQRETLIANVDVLVEAAEEAIAEARG